MDSFSDPQTQTFQYDELDRVVNSSVTGAATANFYYDADGKQVQATVNGVTTYYIGNHYIIPLRDEVKNGVATNELRRYDSSRGAHEWHALLPAL